MAYSYLVNPILFTDTSATYVISMYVYVPSTCNANFTFVVEGGCSFIETNVNVVDNITIGYARSNVKDKAFWMYAKIKPNTTNGNLKIMFYPNTNTSDVFTTGYQLVTGITIYKGDTVYRPSLDNSINGLYTVPDTNSIYNNRLEFNDFIES